MAEIIQVQKTHPVLKLNACSAAFTSKYLISQIVLLRANQITSSCPVVLLSFMKPEVYQGLAILRVIAAIWLVMLPSGLAVRAEAVRSKGSPHCII